jgi:predicted aspartyl protease
VQNSGVHRRDEVNDHALRHALEPGSGVTLLGQVLAPQAAYVVKVAPPDGRVEYVFYDKGSCLITRRERAVIDQRVITTYEDFRTTNGATWAWHVHQTDGRPYNDIDWALVSVDDKTPIDPGVFQPPRSDTSHFTLASPKIVLPGKILADRVILTAQVGHHKVDFQLDSGSSQIVLDKSVADALGLPTFGRQTQTTAGTYTSTRSAVPRIDFGGATLENVAVITAPFHNWADESTPVAGLLGYDFIASCVIHIDYLHGEADALSAASFQAPPNAIEIPIRLDDGVPVIDVKISATMSDRFILDTGADRSVLFSRFVTEHPNAAADQGLGEQFTEAYPFLNAVTGVGGEINVTHTQVPSLSIGSATFPRWLFSVVHDASAFEVEDYDGLIGQDVLRNFDVYLDYPNLKVYFVPNERYHERWGT